MNSRLKAAMNATYDHPPVTVARLAQLYDDYRKKRRRFLRFSRTGGPGGLDHPHVMQALESADRAFRLVRDSLLEATGCNRNMACAALLPDGRLLVHIIDEEDAIGDHWTFIQCVRVGRFVKLP
jgi:hypothetical protein